jgi:hypothetical protein
MLPADGASPIKHVDGVCIFRMVSSHQLDADFLFNRQVVILHACFTMSFSQGSSRKLGKKYAISPRSLRMPRRNTWRFIVVPSGSVMLSRGLSRVMSTGTVSGHSQNDCKGRRQRRLTRRWSLNRHDRTTSSLCYRNSICFRCDLLWFLWLSICERVVGSEFALFVATKRAEAHHGGNFRINFHVCVHDSASELGCS